MIVDDYLFEGNLLCFPLCSLRLSILDELHCGPLWTIGWKLWENKTLALVKANFFWPRLKKDVAKFIERCNVCHMAKTRS